MRDRGEGAAVLLDYGRGGLVPRMVPERLRKQLFTINSAGAAVPIPPARSSTGSAKR